MYFSPQLHDYTPIFGYSSSLSPQPHLLFSNPSTPLPFPRSIYESQGIYTPWNTAIDHALNLACKTIHCNNRVEINGHILSCNHQLSSIKIHPAAWPLSTDLTLCWLTQFPWALQKAGNSWGVGKPQTCLLLPGPGSCRAPARAARLAAHPPWGPWSWGAPPASPWCSQPGRPCFGNSFLPTVVQAAAVWESS